MTFQDIFKTSFIEQFQMGEGGATFIIVPLLFAGLMGLYLFVIYRFFVRKSMYNINMNIALVGMTVITTAVILTIQSNLVLSLGMVGALSIVRYRTAVKDPMDLFFLFWAIANGMMCGASQYALNILVSLILTVVVFLLAQFPSMKAPYILVVNGDASKLENDVTEILETYCKYYKVKSRNIARNSERMIVELRTDEPQEMMDEMKTLEQIEKFSLLTYEGDVVA